MAAPHQCRRTVATCDLAPSHGHLAPASDGTTQQLTYTLVSCLGVELRSSSIHMNARRLKATCGNGCTRPNSAPDDPSSARCINACAIVPLNPNELTPATPSLRRAVGCRQARRSTILTHRTAAQTKRRGCHVLARVLAQLFQCEHARPRQPLKCARDMADRGTSQIV